MKRGIAFLIVLTLGLLPCAGWAEEDIIRLEFSEIPAMNQSWQMIAGTDSAMLISSLHPGIALIMENETPSGLPAQMEQLAGLHALPGTGQLQHVLTGWMKEIGAEEETGLYTGDSFDRASSRMTAAVRAGELSRLEERLERIQPRTAEAAAGFQAVLRGGRRLERMLQQNPGVSLHTALYDAGNNIVIQAEREGETVLLISLDLARLNHIQAVVSFAENGQIYDLGLESLMEPNHQLTCTVTLCADPEKAGYAQASRNHPILTLSGTLSEAAGETLNHEWEIQGALSSARHGDLLRWAGMLDPTEPGPTGNIHLTDGQGKTLGALILDYGTEAEARPGNENRIDLRQETDPEAMMQLERLYIQYGLMILQACLLQ